MAKTAVTPEPAIYCRKCSYDLRGQVEHRCPECGRAYDPDDAKTFRRKPRGSAGRWLKRSAVALVVLLLLAAAPYAWLYYDWRQEQPAVKRMKDLEVRVYYKRIDLPILPRLLPERYAWARERVKSIDAWGRPVTDADLFLISRCRRLEELRAGHSSVSDKGIEALSELRELSLLVLRGKGITDASAPRLARCQKLERLWLVGTSLTDAGLGDLCTLKERTGLGVQSPVLTDAGLPALANLPKLRTLYVSAPSIDDSGLATLARLSRLKDLSIGTNGCTPAGEKNLRQSLPNCHIDMDCYTPAPAAAPSPSPSL